LLPARRLMAADVALVAIASVHLTVPAAHIPLWAVIGLAGAAAVLTAVRLHRPACNVLEDCCHAANSFPSLRTPATSRSSSRAGRAARR